MNLLHSKKRCTSLLALVALGVVLLGSQVLAADRITYLVPAATPFSDAVLEILPEFEKESGIDVEVVEVPFDVMFEKAMVESATGTGRYDLIQMERPFLPAFVEPGYLTPLDEYLPASLVNDVFAVHLRHGTFNGKLYSLPHSNDVRSLYYRTDLFAEAGLSSAPQDWSQLLDNALKLNDPDNGLYGLLVAGTSIPGVWVASDFIHQAGGEIIDVWGNSVVNSPSAVYGLQFFTDLLRKYEVLPPGTANYKWHETRNLFAQGKSAMVFEFNDIIPLLEDPTTSRVGGKYALAQIPGYVRRGTNNAGKVLGIPADSKNPEAAAQLLQWIVGQRAQTRMCRLTGTMTCRKSIVDHLIEIGDAALPPGDPDSKARWEFYGEIVRTTYELPRTPKEPEIEDILQRAVSSSLGGIDSPQDALDQANEKIEKLMASE